MYIAGALVVIAIGAVLRWAVDLDGSVINVPLTGLIVLIAGIIGLIAAFAVWFARRGRGGQVESPDDRFGA